MARFDRRLLKYAVAWGVWTVFALFFFTQDMSRKAYWGEPSPWWHYLASWLIGAWVLAALTPSMLALGRRWPLERRGWPGRVAIHFAFSVGFAAFEMVGQSAIAWYVGFLGALTVTSFGQAFGVLMVVSFHNSIMSYWTILGVQHGLAYYRRYQEREKQALRLELRASELEAQLVHARLDALKMQLQPHFLFNTMNAISALRPAQHGEYVITLTSGASLRSGRTYHDAVKALASNPFDRSSPR
jgi:hypothetical protein